MILSDVFILVIIIRAGVYLPTRSECVRKVVLVPVVLYVIG